MYSCRDYRLVQILSLILAKIVIVYHNLLVVTSEEIYLLDKLINFPLDIKGINFVYLKRLYFIYSN